MAAIYKIMDLTLFDASSGLSDQMRTFYDDYMIDYAMPELVHGQFGQKRNIPANGGKTISFDVTSALPKITTPLTEGVTPTGQDMDWSTLTATVAQYGGYITISDIADLTAARKQLTEAARRLGDQAGRSIDSIDREVITGGTNVIYGEGSKLTRAELVGGAASGNDYLTVRAVRSAVRALKNANAKKIDGYYVGIIHPDSEFDLMDDPDWKYPHQYCDTEELYEGELGQIAGVRFVETTEAKKFVSSGKDDRDVYATMILGADAYGITEIEGGGLQMIIKPVGSGDDPLNQRATAGWKTTHVCERLVEEYMVRIEHTTSFNEHDEN
jgi:N4-gp56 family major capsid protein